MANAAFILASSSPRRLHVLETLGVQVAKIVSPDIDETPYPQEKPRDLALRLAQQKARTVAEKEVGAWILAADTVVSVGRRILPKAETDADVRACFHLMQGRRQHIYTGMTLHTPQGKVLSRVSDSTVIFRSMSAQEIESYVASGEGIGKAGGYGMQGRAAALIRSMSGSYTGIIGLSAYDVMQMLRGAGWKEKE